MSTVPENEFDLEKLFLPAWAQEPASVKQYSQYEGREERSFDRRSDGGGRPQGRRPGGPRRDGARGGSDRGAPSRDRGPRDRAAGGDRRGPDRGPDRGQPRERREHREPPQPLPELDVSLVPDEKGVESLARQIKMTGRAYPLFGIAQMIL